MKRVFALALPLCAAMVLFGCASNPPASGGMPSNIANARRNAPQDVIVGIGGAKMGAVSESRNIAATRARADISNIKEISQAQAAAMLAVPAMSSFDAEKRMNEAFEQARREGW